MSRPRAPLLQRFNALVDRNGPIPARRALGRCWIWKGKKNESGYGLVRPGGTAPSVRAHRAAFFLEYGRWPDPCALHKCDNPACVRPRHLFEGTRIDNIRDMHAKGRGGAARGEASGRAKLTDRQIAEIRSKKFDNVSYADIGRKFGVTRVHARFVRLGMTRKNAASGSK